MSSINTFSTIVVYFVWATFQQITSLGEHTFRSPTAPPLTIRNGPKGSRCLRQTLAEGGADAPLDGEALRDGPAPEEMAPDGPLGDVSPSCRRATPPRQLHSRRRLAAHHCITGA